MAKQHKRRLPTFRILEFDQSRSLCFTNNIELSETGIAKLKERKKENEKKKKRKQDSKV